MSYYRVLGFDKEPFSTSPDPEFFYSSGEHDRALTNILIELRLKRGLSVVLGDVGTGKTTLSRKLVQDLRQREDFIFHIMLDPSFENRSDFIYSLAKNFGVPLQSSNSSAPTLTDMRESLERFLFQKGVVEVKTVIVIIDEAQNLERAVLLTALSRLGEGSRVVLTHDVAQRDNLRVGRHDGIASVISVLRGHPLFGHVTFTRSERSPIAALATSLLDDPRQ